MKSLGKALLASVVISYCGPSFAADLSGQYLPLMKEMHDAQCVIKTPGVSQSEMMEAQNKLLKANNGLSKIKMKIVTDGAAYTKYSKDNTEVMNAPCGNMKPVSRGEYVPLLKRYSEANCKMIGAASDPAKQAKAFRVYDDLKKQVNDVSDRLEGTGDKKAYEEFSAMRRKADMATSCN